jgi:thiamine biosynthesis lipoprotein
VTYEATSFRAMGTDVEVLAAPCLPEASVGKVKSLFAEMEARFSRFLAESELALLNRSAGRPFTASPLMREALGRAVEASRESGGLFSPFLLRDVEAAGYTESIERVRGSERRQRASGPAGAVTPLILEDTVLLPYGCGVDLGGFVKGWTVDRAAALMAPSANWVINAGGDLLARGEGPDGAGWIIGVEDPFAPDRCLVTLAVRDSAVATSSTMRRRWSTQNGAAHHLIDPRTGQPAETDLVSVTVMRTSVARAEVAAKQLLLLGERRALAQAEDKGIPSVLVNDRGGLRSSGAMEGAVVG